MEEGPKTLADMSMYVFYIWDSQAMKVIGNKNSDSSSENTSEQGRKEGEGQDKDYMEIVDV